MKVESKFELNDRVYVRVNKREHKDILCPFCGGAQLLEVEGERILCRNCVDGYVTINGEAEKVEMAGNVKKIYVEQSAEGTRIDYKIAFDDKTSNMNYITFEESKIYV